MFQGAVSIFISSFSFRIPFPFSNISTHLLSRPLDLLSSEVLDHPPRPLWAPPSRLKCYDDDDDEDDDDEDDCKNILKLHSLQSRVEEFFSPSLRDSPFFISNAPPPSPQRPKKS